MGGAWTLGDVEKENCEHSAASGCIRAAIERTRTENGRMSHLDGLRAMALVAVLLFHFGNILPGGFLGVDVFFVLSGFLMSRGLLLQMQNSSFSFSRFLHARALRICPSLYITVLATLGLAVFILPLPELNRVCSVSSFASMFGSNFKFFSESGYHDSSSLSKPLLHTWSLAVEGQFYTLWSFVGLVGSVGLALSTMVILCAFSVAFHFVESGNDTALFFLVPSRLYQFGIGALALLFYDIVPEEKSTLLSASGLVMVIMSFCLVEPQHGPTLLVSLPVLVGTALLIASPRGALNQEWLFSNARLRYLGTISYSVYLVHWPAIVLASQVISDRQVALVVAAFATCILSPILYYGVEEKFRPRREKPSKTEGTFLTLASLGAILLASHLISVATDKKIQRAAEGELAEGGSSFGLHTGEWYRDEMGRLESKMRHEDGKIVGSVAGLKHYTIVTGDSFTRNMLYSMSAFDGKDGEESKYLYVARPACLPLIGNKSMVARRVTQDRSKYETNCRGGAEQIEQALLQKKPNKMIFAAHWDDYVFDKESLTKFSDVLSILSVNVDEICVFGMLPVPPSSPLPCLWTAREKGGTETKCPGEYEVSQLTLDGDSALKNMIRRDHPKVRYISPLQSKLCHELRDGSTVRCKSWDKDDGPYYYDEIGHTTVLGSKTASREVLDFMAA